jgi:hypothetical protein
MRGSKFVRWQWLVNHSNSDVKIKHKPTKILCKPLWHLVMWSGYIKLRRIFQCDIHLKDCLSSGFKILVVDPTQNVIILSWTIKWSLVLYSVYQDISTPVWIMIRLVYNTVSLDEWSRYLRSIVLFQKRRELLAQTRSGTSQKTCMSGNTAVRTPNTACALLLTKWIYQY